MTYLITLQKNGHTYFLDAVPKKNVRRWTTRKEDALILSISTESLMSFINEYLYDVKDEIEVFGIRRTITPKSIKK